LFEVMIPTVERIAFDHIVGALVVKRSFRQK